MIKLHIDQLGVDDLNKLRGAIEVGRVDKLKGFGAKSQQKILERLRFLVLQGQRVRLEACVSLRRRREIINDIDILVSTTDAHADAERFVKSPGVMEILGRGDTKVSVLIDRGKGQRIQADLRLVTDEQFPFALHYFT